MIISCFIFSCLEKNSKDGQKTAYAIVVNSLLYYFFGLLEPVFLAPYFFFDKRFAVYF